MIFLSTMLLSNLQISEDDWFALRRTPDLGLVILDRESICIQECLRLMEGTDREVFLFGVQRDLEAVPSDVRAVWVPDDLRVVVCAGHRSAGWLSGVEAEHLLRQMLIDQVPAWVVQSIGLCLCRFVLRRLDEPLPRAGLLEAFHLGFGLGKRAPVESWESEEYEESEGSEEIEA